MTAAVRIFGFAVRSFLLLVSPPFGFHNNAAPALCGSAGEQVAFGVIETANATVLICYIENPHALHDDHPESYEKLVSNQIKHNLNNAILIRDQ